MSAFFELLEQLVALATPSVIALQGVLGMTLVAVPDANPHWVFHRGNSASGMVAEADFRIPGKGATTGAPFLAIELRDAPVRVDDLERRYGRARIAGAGGRRPGRIGHEFPVGGRCVAVDADARSGVVQAFSIDYARPVAGRACG